MPEDELASASPTGTPLREHRDTQVPSGDLPEQQIKIRTRWRPFPRGPSSPDSPRIEVPGAAGEALGLPARRRRWTCVCRDLRPLRLLARWIGWLLRLCAEREYGLIGDDWGAVVAAEVRAGWDLEADSSTADFTDSE